MAIASAFLTAGLFGATMALADHDSDTHPRLHEAEWQRPDRELGIRLSQQRDGDLLESDALRRTLEPSKVTGSLRPETGAQ